MNARCAPPADAARPTVPPFVIRRPAAETATPLVFASPHSGRFYPVELMAASVLDSAGIRRSEDAFVDALINDAPDHGVAVIRTDYARAFVDVNREPYELDAGMFEDDLPAFARIRTPRVAAGLGSIARIVAEGQEIYGRKLTFAEARLRIERVHEPYHRALRDLLDATVERFGCAVLIDWHSMPSVAARAFAQSGDARSGAVLDVVLGDRFGTACAPSLTRRAEAAFEVLGYKVARNAPYAGGHTTQNYGKPATRVHALQIEINRALYLNEGTLEPSADFANLKRDLKPVFAAMAAAAWTLARRPAA
jgi:N-formylglutamate amidohydrolase